MGLRSLVLDLTRASIIYGVCAFGAAYGSQGTSVGAGVLDPVARAAAQPLSVGELGARAQTMAFVEPCSKSYEREGVTHFYAEHSFVEQRPSTQELSSVRILGHRTHVSTATADGVPGYEYELVTQGIYVRSGAVAVECGDSAAGTRFDEARFIFPKVYKLELDTVDPWSVAPSSADRAR